jgi:hypothetical protein
MATLRVLEPLADLELNEPVPFGPLTYQPLQEELRNTIGLSQGTDQRILQELAAECDRLRQCQDDSDQKRLRKPEQSAAISTRRIQALKILADQLNRVRERGSVDTEISAIAMVVRLMRDVMRDVGIQADARELVMQNLIMRISSERSLNSRSHAS